MIDINFNQSQENYFLLELKLMVKCELSSGDMIIHVQPVPEDFRNYSTLRSQKQRDLSNSFRVF